MKRRKRRGVSGRSITDHTYFRNTLEDDGLDVLDQGDQPDERNVVSSEVEKSMSNDKPYSFSAPPLEFTHCTLFSSASSDEEASADVFQL